MLTDTDSDTYAVLTNTTTDTSPLFLGGFDFSQVPSSAIVLSYTVRFKLEGAESMNTLSISGQRRSLYKDNNSINGQSLIKFTIRKQVPQISSAENPVAWSELVAAGDDFNILVPALVTDHGGQTNIYGADIQVEYDLPVNKVVYGTTVLVDLTEDTVTPDDLSEGVTAHDKSGGLITGTNQRGIMVIRDSSDSHGGTVRTITSGEAQVGGMDEATLKYFISRSSGFTDIDWPEGLTSIGDYAFANCSWFNPSSLPSGLVSVGNSSFLNCSRLALTSLPDGISSISQSAFYGCSNLALTSLPNNLTSINYGSFQNCYKLTITELPSGVTSISSYAFGGCCEISSISSTGAITSLSSLAFNGSASHPMTLTSASFPNMTQTSNISTVFGSTIASNACQQLAFCDIGSTVGIGTNAFANCYALQTLVLRKTASVCSLANVSAFLNTPMRGYNSLTGTVYVPQALIESYKTATNWSTLYNDGTVTFVAIEGSQYERE